MKYNEIREETDLRKKLLYIDEHWSTGNDWRQASLKRITGYLFTLNSGGLVASLAYLVAKDSGKDVRSLIWCFLIGTICITIHAVVDYYQSESELKQFNSDLSDFYANNIEWEDLVEKKSTYHSSDVPLHILGWGAGLCFFIGLISTVCKI